MNRIGYFEYLREYAKLNRAEPRIQSAGDMWRLMAAPIACGSLLYPTCEMLLAHFNKYHLPNPGFLCLRTAVAVFLVIYLLPMLTCQILFEIRLKPEIAAIQDEPLKTLRRELQYSHLPWFSTWHILLIPCAAYFSGMLCCSVCDTYFCRRMVLYVFGCMLSAFSIGAGRTAIKKMRTQIPQKIKCHVPAKTSLSNPLRAQEIYLKASAIVLYVLAVICLISPVLIFLNPSPKDSQEPSIAFFLGTMFVFSLMAYGVILFGSALWRKATHSQAAIHDIMMLSGTKLVEKVEGFSDYDLCIVFENLLDKNNLNLLETVANEMRIRGLTGDASISTLKDLYLLIETNDMQGGGNIRVAERYIIIEPTNNYGTNNLFIRNTSLDSAVISEKHWVMTMTNLEVKFRRKTFRDKFVIKTDKLDQWLLLFDKFGIPVEDNR